jgi:hypothetical protein
MPLNVLQSGNLCATGDFKLFRGVSHRDQYQLKVGQTPAVTDEALSGKVLAVKWP